MENDMAADYMTTKQVAEVFHVTPRTISRWRELGLPCAHIGRNNYYRAADVREFIESRMKKTAEPQGSGNDGE